jgi:hypothetical protein
MLEPDVDGALGASAELSKPCCCLLLGTAAGDTLPVLKHTGEDEGGAATPG